MPLVRGVTYSNCLAMIPKPHMSSIHKTFGLFYLIIALAVAGCSNPSQQKETEKGEANPEPSPTRFDIQRGVNISHWLSQSDKRGAEREEYFTEDDVAFIAQTGFDHIRIPIDEEQMWDENGEKHPEAFALLHQALAWSQDARLKVIIDLHILRSHYFNANFKGTENTLFTSEASQNQFYDFWLELSSELSKYPTDFLAYELMNEPVVDNAEDWNKLVQRCTQAVRELEPHRKIVIGSNMWQNPKTFDELEVPPDDPNIILSFHFYIPMMLTHYKASWVKTGAYEGPVHYPGQTVKEEDLQNVTKELADQVRNASGNYYQSALLDLLEKPLQKAQETGLQLYCGEWGCYYKAPKPDRLRWYADMREIFEKNGIAWTIWDYKGGFGIKERETEEVRYHLLSILTDFKQASTTSVLLPKALGGK